MKNKYIFLGEIESINTELIFKSFKFLKNKVRYIIIGDLSLFKKHSKFLKNIPNIKEVNNPLDFSSLNSNFLNFFHLAPKKTKIENMLAQLELCNFLSNETGNDLVTLPINKSVFKKNLKFNGMTEYFGKLNKKNTIMLMKGEKFSITPITTHINLKDVGKGFISKIESFFKTLLQSNINKNLLKDYKNFIFLCFNPHCSENGTLGNEDLIINKYLKKFKNIKFKLVSADSAFNRIEEKTLFLSFYHDQALIPFKILNKKSFNQTLGLNYRRLSPSHGTAVDIKFQNLADNTSYIQCMIN